MNANAGIGEDADERKAVRTAEMLDGGALDDRECLLQLLSSAYREAYRKAAEATRHFNFQ